MTKNRILVVGSANVDLVTFMKRVPVAGETVIGKDFQQHFGGKGAYLLLNSLNVHSRTLSNSLATNNVPL